MRQLPDSIWVAALGCARMSVSARTGLGRRRTALMLVLAAGLLVVLGGCGGSSSSDSDSASGGGSDDTPRPLVDIYAQRVQPAQTGAGIDAAGLIDRHFVALPQNADDRLPRLVVFLGGSASSPNNYRDISRYAARLGYGVIDLGFPNDSVVGSTCADDDTCFTQFRGETLFGAGTAYAIDDSRYDSAQIDVDKANSIVNRLVSALDYLSLNQGTTNPDPAYWRQFLAANDQSPYVVSSGNVYPDWNRIIIAGHSQGGGDAAFLALNLPADQPLHRVVLFSAPNDHVGRVSAGWIPQPSATPLARFWGLRNANEGALGDFVAANWANMGSAGVGGADTADEINIGDGSNTPNGAHRLVIDSPDSRNIITNHNSTAVDSAHEDTIQSAWRYVLTGDGAD